MIIILTLLFMFIHFEFFFFFSSRRRHTRFDCDWSSDVCSSDLASSPWPQAIIWFEVHTVSWSPFHAASVAWRSEEHTSELQSQSNLVCRLLLEKKKSPCTSASLWLWRR